MSDRRTQFYLDKHNGKWLGVCAGIADYTGLDVTLVRVGMVLLTLATSGWAFLGYIAAAWFAPKKPIEHYYTSPEDTKFWQGVRTNPRRSTAEVRSKFRDIDRRLADIELMYTSRNTRLADEIEQLR
ncbi:phage shock protein C (PspC) family protein [Hephaestia caeni]|uniref:Phage shock protein C (PspC) family protein n=1 Tax=Hephaestia caeni TaxID=645617 RepID=A0A397PIZ2_9SPHN|nr:envelope stress response membrane protein PspC [Hephaestia caeni]RIA45641.1 phage shock protein C (PspC) family protein [Hephaestia caeni]